MSKPSRAAAALLAAAALVVAACGGSDDDTSSNSSGAAKASSNKPVTINWWHIANNDPLKTIWKNAADQYMAAHPNVKIKITVLENEAFKAKLTTNMQAGKPPDIFQSWGGGTLKEQADAGLVKDITEPTQAVDRHPQRRGRRALQDRRQAVRDPVQPRPRGRLVQQEALQEGRASTARRPPGTSSWPTSRS